MGPERLEDLVSRVPFEELPHQVVRCGAPLAQRAARADLRRGSRLSYTMGRITDLAEASRAVFSDDARMAMKEYVEIISGHGPLDAKALLADVEEQLDRSDFGFTGN